MRIYKRCPLWSHKHFEFHSRKNLFIMPSANNDIIDICKRLKANSRLPAHYKISLKCKFLQHVLQSTEADFSTLIICFSFEALPQWPKPLQMTLLRSCASSCKKILNFSLVLYPQAETFKYKINSKSLSFRGVNTFPYFLDYFSFDRNLRAGKISDKWFLTWTFYFDFQNIFLNRNPIKYLSGLCIMTCRSVPLRYAPVPKNRNCLVSRC